MAKSGVRRPRKKCASALRFEAMLVEHDRTIADVEKFLKKSGYDARSLRNVRNFFSGRTSKASREIRGHLIAFAKAELETTLTDSYFEVVPSYLTETQAFIRANKRYRSIVADHCRSYWSYSLETSDVEIAGTGELKGPPPDGLRVRAVTIRAEGENHFAFELGNVRGFALAGADTINLFGYEEGTDRVTYVHLRTDPRTLGLPDVALYGFQAGVVRRDGQAPLRGMARRVVYVPQTGGADEPEPPLSGAATTWLLGNGGRRGTNAGFVVDLDGEAANGDD
jgi:hypothetical protein